MATAEIVGSWFPSGYYGHFRSKSRNDFLCEYRNLAKPQPPKKFIQRARQPTPKHVFSHHDNRESFLNDALYFEQGLGRKRVPNETYNFKPDFITWMPEREFVKKSRPLLSSYRAEFKQKSVIPNQRKATVSTTTTTLEPPSTKCLSNTLPTNVPQIMVKRPKTSFDGVPTTSYRYAHGEYNPNKEKINAMNNDALQLSLLNRKDRAMSAKSSSGRESVASCLVWYNPENERKEEKSKPKNTIPAATQTMIYTPHPPPSKDFTQTEQNNVPKPQVVLNNMEPPKPETSVLAQTTTASQPPTLTWAPPAQVMGPPAQTSAPPVQLAAPPKPEPSAPHILAE